MHCTFYVHIKFGLALSSITMITRLLIGTRNATDKFCFSVASVSLKSVSNSGEGSI